MRYVYDFWQGMTESTVPLAVVLTCVSVTFAFCTVVALIHAMVALCKRKRREKLRLAEAERRLQFTLPQRENEYIRVRLQNELQVQEETAQTRQVRVRLGYARALLGKLRGAPLSVAERLQAEEMGKVLALYRGKENWTVEEVCGLNDLCAALLKLSAKYAV